MPDPDDPRLPYAILRMGLFERLVRVDRVPLLDAEHWIREWEAKAEDIGRPRDSDGYWAEAHRWITGERAARRPEPH